MSRKPRRPAGSSAHSSTLPFAGDDLMRVRVTPAQLASMCNVTRQSVSKWIKKGWVSVGADGLLDPRMAIRQYMDCVNPLKMRARVLKDATASIPELRARIESLEAEVVAAKIAVRNQCTDENARRISAFCEAIVDRFEELEAAHQAGRADEWLGLLEAREILCFNEDEMRELEAYYKDSRETSKESEGG